MEAFCIGSEMRGLTQIRGPNDSFPVVEALLKLAQDVRRILGPDVKISYAADWSEYSGYGADGNHYFHLDALWASDDIDFIGIDNYMPVSDWRDGTEHADSQWRSIYNLDYLKANISGGEGFDWYYASTEDAFHQNRTPIRDLAHDEDWIFRVKDLKSWWANDHHNRVDGTRSDQSTAWHPRSKPIRFTEFGCAAIDKGTNEPNKFLDNKSSESALPRGSLGSRDDFIQMQYFRAFYEFWNDSQNNPTSDVYDGLMLDMDHCYAWAWDARPYPEFPRNIEAWSDGQNYYRGHWLNGRASSAPLDRVIREICSDADTVAVDTDSLFGVVHGYNTADTQSGRSKIQPLSVVYGFDCSEDQGTLRFLSRGVSKICSLNEGKFVLISEGGPSVELTRSSNTDIISMVRFSFVEADGSFTTSVSEAHDKASVVSATLEAEYPMVLPMASAKATTRRWLMESQLAHEQISLEVPISTYFQIKDATLLFCEKHYRIDRIEVGDTVIAKAVRVEPSVYTPQDLEAEPVDWVPHKEVGPVSRLWMDLPIFNAGQTMYGPHLAVVSDPWLEPVNIWSSDDDSNYSLNTKILAPSGIGRTLTEMTRCSSGVLDRGDALLVDMSRAELESTSMSGILSGRNLMAIGDGDPENWEIFQFMNAEIQSPGRYRISSRLRGVAGTDADMPDSWPAGSYVVLLDNGLNMISLAGEHLEVDRHYRIGFESEPIGSDVVQHDVINFRGTWARPFSIVHFSVQVGLDNHHHFRWIRRTRFGGDSWSGFDVALNEEYELYSFVVKSSDGTVLLERTVQLPDFILQQDVRASLGIEGPYSAEVCQISSKFGMGPVRKLNVPLDF